jgi:hypothetical protein
MKAKQGVGVGNATNRGFSPMVNQWLNAARGEYLVLLN